MEDLDRLRDAIRDELSAQHGIRGLEIDSEWLDTLADSVSSRVEYGFDVEWNPRWVRPGEPQRWEEDGEFYVECLKCRRVTIHHTYEDGTSWFTAHAFSSHT